MSELDPYRAAQLAARDAAGSLTTAAARSVQVALDRYVAQLTERLAQLPGGTPAAQREAVRRALQIAQQSRGELATAITSAVQQNRSVAFSEVLAIWQHAGVDAARAAGIPGALLGAVQTPNLRMAGQFASLGGVHHLKSLTASAAAAEHEVSALMTAGLVANVSPQEMARRLRPYMSGAEEFERAFPRKDERLAAIQRRRAQLPKDLQGAAGRLRSNALRVAYSEVHNARAEAELQAFAVDPMVEAVKWTLSPFRGSQTVPDICDAYARNDFYGLGAGVYPLDAVPLSPHPRDRCERVPVLRTAADWARPRPVGVPRTLDPARAQIAVPGAPKLTKEQGDRIRAQLDTQFRQLEQHSSPDAMRKLVAEGDREAATLAAEAAAQRARVAVPTGWARTPAAPPGGWYLPHVPDVLPLVRVREGAVAPAGTTGKALTDAARAVAAAAAQGHTYTLTDGREVLIGGAGLKEATRNAAYEPQGQMFAAFAEIIARAVLVAEEEPGERAKAALRRVYKYLALVQLGDGALEIVQATLHDFGLPALSFHDLRIWQTRERK